MTSISLYVLYLVLKSKIAARAKGGPRKRPCLFLLPFLYLMKTEARVLGPNHKYQKQSSLLLLCASNRSYSHTTEFLDLWKWEWIPEFIHPQSKYFNPKFFLKLPSQDFPTNSFTYLSPRLSLSTTKSILSISTSSTLLCSHSSDSVRHSLPSASPSSHHPIATPSSLPPILFSPVLLRKR